MSVSVRNDIEDSRELERPVSPLPQPEMTFNVAISMNLFLVNSDISQIRLQVCQIEGSPCSKLSYQRFNKMLIFISKR
jgi:hypothetical protein